MTVLLFLAVLGLLVIVHELGHFTAAKLARVQVLEFGVGLPPRVFGFTWGGTTYSLNLLPLGGFVRMLGEEDPTAPASFAGKRAWQRLVILGAGSTMNAVLPVLLLTVVFMTPQPVLVTDVTVLSVAPGSPAERAGSEPGDLVRTADGKRIANSSGALHRHPPTPRRGHGMDGGAAWTARCAAHPGGARRSAGRAGGRWHPPHRRPVDRCVG